MDVSITQSAKKTNEKFERFMKILWGENIIECNMKYSIVNIIACPNKRYVYY